MDHDVFRFGVGVQRVNVGSSEIDERAGGRAGMFRALPGVEVKADAAAIEERHIGRGHQEWQAKDIAVKGCRTVDFFDGDSNLEDSGEWRGCGHGKLLV